MKTTILFVLASSLSSSLYAQIDPGPRRGPTAAGKPVMGASIGEMQMFEAGKDAFSEVDDVVNGLGPRFNLDSCAEELAIEIAKDHFTKGEDPCVPS